MTPAKKYYKTRPPIRAACAVCGAAFTGTPRRRYCSRACKMRAYRGRHNAPRRPQDGAQRP